MRLVVDACVLQSAGKKEGCSSACRGTLMEIGSVGHRVHYDSFLKKEWDQHPSPLGSKWRLQMQQRGLLVFKARKPDLGLRRAVKLNLADCSAHKSALKDVHLLTLALDADKTILSLDGTARGLFVTVGVGERRLRKLLWIDPTQHPDETTAWIRNEAEPLGQWRLVNNEAVR